MLFQFRSRTGKCCRLFLIRYGSKGVSLYKNDRWNVAVNSRYLPSGQKTIIFGQKQPQQTKLLRKVTIYLDIKALLGPISCTRDPNRVQNRFPYIKMIIGT